MQKTSEQVAHINQVADLIEGNPESFDMNYWRADIATVDEGCGMIACIGGWSDMVLLEESGIEPFSYGDQLDEADGVGRVAERFGISELDAEALCYEAGANAWKAMYEHLRAKGMASALRDIASDRSVGSALKDAVERFG